MDAESRGGSDRLTTARRAARSGGNVALDLFRENLAVDRKAGKTDLVTRADREAQVAVVEAITAEYPDAFVVGEEGERAETVPATGPAWIVDPIDGTNNYVRGIRRWATAVAVVVDGDPVAAVLTFPALDDTYEAGSDGVTRNGERVTVSDRSDPERFTVAPTLWWDLDRRTEYAAATREVVTRFGDMARFRSTQTTLALVAAGGLEGAITNVAAAPWDTVAGAYMIEQAGGTVTDLDGDPWTADTAGLVASNGERHDELLAAARALERDR
jgi:myo-inositol-1(or 4)-monophosphatase